MVADTALESGYDEIAFLDDQYPNGGRADAPVLGPLSMVNELGVKWPNAIAAIGQADLRMRLFWTLRRLGIHTPDRKSVV